MSIQTLEQEKTKRKSKANEDGRAPHNAVIQQLQNVLSEYLESNPHMSLNGISKRCGVSEPTLRRIMKAQNKTHANASTIIGILSFVSKETRLHKIVSKYPGPIADYLKEVHGSGFDEKVDSQFSLKLNDSLREPCKYQIYKLSVNKNGVSAEEVRDLFGYLGKSSLDELIGDGLLELKDGRYFGTIPKFTLHNDLFVRCFKATSDFIKPHKLSEGTLNNIFANISRSITIEAYHELIRIQQSALRKSIRVVEDEKNQGNIPAFILAAIDTLSTQSANELS